MIQESPLWVCISWELKQVIKEIPALPCSFQHYFTVAKIWKHTRYMKEVVAAEEKTSLR